MQMQRDYKFTVVFWSLCLPSASLASSFSLSSWQYSQVSMLHLEIVLLDLFCLICRPMHHISWAQGVKGPLWEMLCATLNEAFALLLTRVSVRDICVTIFSCLSPKALTYSEKFVLGLKVIRFKAVWSCNYKCVCLISWWWNGCIGSGFEHLNWSSTAACTGSLGSSSQVLLLNLAQKSAACSYRISMYVWLIYPSNEPSLSLSAFILQ